MIARLYDGIQHVYHHTISQSLHFSFIYLT